MLDSNRFIARIKTVDEYKFLKIDYNSCIRTITKKWLEFVYNDKIILSIKGERNKTMIEISKELIENSIDGYWEKEIVLKYYDDSSPHGHVLGLLIFENK